MAHPPSHSQFESRFPQYVRPPAPSLPFMGYGDNMCPRAQLSPLSGTQGQQGHHEQQLQQSQPASYGHYHPPATSRYEREHDWNQRELPSLSHPLQPNPYPNSYSNTTNEQQSPSPDQVQRGGAGAGDTNIRSPSYRSLYSRAHFAHSITNNPNAKVKDLPAHDPPKKFIGNDGQRTYELVVEQQPKRARQCGFGDKDRRPITPAPCVRVLVKDIASDGNREFDLDPQTLLLLAEVYKYDGTQDANLVKHQQSCQAATHVIVPNSQGGYTTVVQPPVAPPGFLAVPTPSHLQTQLNGHTLPSLSPDDSSSVLSAQSGQLIRNLIGSLICNANHLTGLDDKMGTWFVMQDLSVRIEGFFRLRFSLFNVGIPGTKGDPNTSDPTQMNRDEVKCLAQVFSEPVHVYSAKKFPGVCKTTELSKKFATQGIKIPIRKEGEGKPKKRKARRDPETDGDASDDYGADDGTDDADRMENSDAED